MTLPGVTIRDGGDPPDGPRWLSLDKAGLVIVGLVFAASLATATPALAGGPWSTQGAKKPDGAYTQYNDASQAVGKTKTYFFRVASSPGLVAPAAVSFSDAYTGAQDLSGYKITWFKGKKQRKNISQAVKGNGYKFTLKPSKTKFFNARVKRTGGPAEICVYGEADGEDISYSSAAFFAINAGLSYCL
jgi:hypothetical protein